MVQSIVNIILGILFIVFYKYVGKSVTDVEHRMHPNNVRRFNEILVILIGILAIFLGIMGLVN